MPIRLAASCTWILELPKRVNAFFILSPLK